MAEPHRNPPARHPSSLGRLSRVLALSLVNAAVVAPAAAQQWIAGESSWYSAANWNPATVPLAGGFVVINNGGKALLDTTLSGGATATPTLGSLHLGVDFAGGATSVTGSVASDGVAIQALNNLSAATAFGGSATFYEGVLGVANAGASFGSVNVGLLASQGVAGTASGTVTVDGSVSVNGNMQVGQLFNSARGTQIDGALQAGDLQGQLAGTFWIVGNVTSGVAAEVGNRSFGEVVAGGSGTLTLAGGSITIVGTTFGMDRVVDGAVTHINQAQGKVQLAGTLATAGDQGGLLVGRTFGGDVDGSLQVGTLAMGSDRFNGVSVGTSTVDGVALGRVTAGNGDLRHSGNLFVGTTTDGRADGAIVLGNGKLQGANSLARVGVSFSGGAQQVQALGSVVAGGGFAGYSEYQVGVLFNTGAGSQASGSLIGQADAGAGNTGNVSIGLLASATGASTVSGEMRMLGSLGMNGNLQVAQLFNSAAGSSVQGLLQVAGDAGIAQGAFLIVGNVTAGQADQVGNRASAEIDVGGGMTLGSGVITIVGTTFGLDRAVDASGTRINESDGTLRIGGTLATAGAQGALMVGRGDAGRVNGAMEVGHLAMGSDRFNGVIIGSSNTGEATGRVEIGDGTLRTTTLNVGNSTSGTALGILRLLGADLDATSVVAGSGSGRAEIELADSQALVADDFTLHTGLLSIERSLLTVGDELSLGAGSTLRLGIGGLARGTEFGAIDALLAFLDGTLELELGDLAFGADNMVFDLVHGIDSLQGNFSAVSYFGLAAGYGASTGIFNAGDGGIYRLTLTRQGVPEPAAWMLVLLALAALGATRRTTAAV